MSPKANNQILSNIEDALAFNRPLEHDVTFGKFSDFVCEYYLPSSLVVGAEWVDTSRPSIKMEIRGFKKQWDEFFSKPLFYVSRKIRLKFHWEGIHVVGANMEGPNCFVFPIPSSNNDLERWTLKVICLPNCTPGDKPAYITVDAIRENMVVRLLSLIAKFIGVLTFIAMGSVPFIYSLSKSIRININNAVLDNADPNLIITLPALVIFTLIIFSKRFDEILSTLMQRTDALTIDEKGNKMIGPGISVLPAEVQTQSRDHQQGIPRRNTPTRKKKRRRE